MFSRFVGMSTLFGISIQHFFFHLFFFSKQYSVLPFHFSKFDKNPFYFLLFWHFPFLFLFFFNSFFSFYFIFFFFLLWILAQTTTLKQTNQISSWNTMDKGFKKERLIKRLNKVTSDDVSRKKTQNTYMAQSRQKWPNLISQRLVQFIQHQWLQKIQVWHCLEERTMRLQQGKYVMHFQINFKIRKINKQITLQK